jgi:septal ring factor EnvC (AmiA/AmiB activator)
MRFSWRYFGCAALSLLLLAKANAQRRHDPLTQLEIDQLRDMAQDPDSRLRLYLKFARARLTTLEEARSDPKVTDRAQQTHDHLQEFVDVYDELNDNIDTFAGQRQDIRRVLRAIIEADTEFHARLHALKDSSANKDDLKFYEFVLTDALDDLASSAKDHVELLTEEEEAAKHKKLLKPQPPSRANLPPQ